MLCRAAALASACGSYATRAPRAATARVLPSLPPRTAQRAGQLANAHTGLVTAPVLSPLLLCRATGARRRAHCLLTTLVPTLAVCKQQMPQVKLLLVHWDSKHDKVKLEPEEIKEARVMAMAK